MNAFYPVIDRSARSLTHVRWMIRRDLPSVLSIESASFPDPWTEDDFLRMLRRRNVIGMVAEAIDGSDDILGFIVYELNKGRLDLANIAVHPDHRRQSVGRQMIAKLVGKLSSHRRTRLVTRSGEGNLPGHLFLRACGLRATGVERGSRADGESEYVFEYRVDAGGDGIGEE